MKRVWFFLLLELLLHSFNANSQEEVIVTNIIIIGNDRTKEHVILREIPFKKGDTLLRSDLLAHKKEAIQTLTQTTLFNFIECKYHEVGDDKIFWEFNVQERWYVWPGIVFSLAETNLNSWWQNKDFERINYGFYVQDLNFRGRRESLTLNFQYGWTRKIGFNYQIPGINKKRTVGAGLEVYYANNREVNYGSAANERLFFKDQRFIQEEFKINGKIEYRPRYFNRHRFNGGTHTVIIDDTVKGYAKEYLPIQRNRSQYLFFSYGFKREKRDNIGYPLTGYVFDSSLDQDGLGIINEDDVMITKLMLTLNTHHHLHGRWYFAQGLKTKTTLLNANETPYFYQRGLGYGNAFIRGYELYVIDGQHHGLWKSNIKYQLLKKRNIDFNLGLLQKFDKLHYSLFLNAFADAGYVIDNINAVTNPLANEWQYSCGLGLDFVTYYDIVIRFEGSVNRQGQPGFYIHFKNPI
ncbi:MAG: POTRA domain-containing protein [Salibacteraceae bacterium]